MRYLGHAWALVVLMRAADPAMAQDPGAGRPPSGLLGTTERSTLGASLSLYGGHDEAVLRHVLGTLESQRPSDGTHGGLTAAVAYHRPVSRWSIDFSGTSDVQHRTGSRLGGLTGHTSSAGLSIGGALSRRNSVRITQSASASSFYQFNPTTGTAVRSLEDYQLPTSDYRIERGQSYHYDVGMTAQQRLGRGMSMTLDVGNRRSRFPGEGIGYTAQYSGVRLSHGLGRSVLFNWGYAFERGLPGNGARASHIHRLDIGPRYAKTLGVARRTQIGGSVGAALVSVESDGRLQTVPRVVATLSMQHHVRRAWSLAAGYHSEPQMVDLYRNPTYTHSVFVALRGSLMRRLGVTASAGGARATPSTGAVRAAQTTMFGSFRAQVAPVRALFMFAEYSFYGFQGLTASASALPFATDARRHTVRAGLGVHLPLLSARR